MTKRIAGAILVFSIIAAPALGVAKDHDFSRVVDVIMQDYEQAASNEIQSFCADEWPIDYKMQDYCFEKSIEARDKAQKFGAMESDEKILIWSNCASKWSDSNDRVNWVMINFCLDEQKESLEKIQSRKIQ